MKNSSCYLLLLPQEGRRSEKGKLRIYFKCLWNRSVRFWKMSIYKFIWFIFQPLVLRILNVMCKLIYTWIEFIILKVQFKMMNVISFLHWFLRIIVWFKLFQSILLSNGINIIWVAQHFKIKQYNHVNYIQIRDWKQNWFIYR